MVIYVGIDAPAALEPSPAPLQKTNHSPTMICLSLLCISPLIALSGCSVSAEAKYVSTINKSLLCTNKDRLHHYFFDLGLLQGNTCLLA